MIRLPNPKSDIQEYIKIIAVINAYVEQNNLTNFNFDDISKNLTQIGNISSQKAFGSKAMAASFRDDKSLDAVFNQSKALSEVLRLLGLIISDSNQHTFRITQFGKYAASYLATPKEYLKKQILELISHAYLNINYKHPQIIANDTISVKPFLATLLILPKIENFITKNEFNYFILTLESDTDKALSDTATEILKARTTKGYFQQHKDSILNNRNISENTASNYTRIPIAFFKSFGLLQKSTIKDHVDLKSYLTDKTKFIDGVNAAKSTEIYIADTEGVALQTKLLTSQNIKFKDIENRTKEYRLFIALKSLTDFYNISEDAKPFLRAKFENYSDNNLFAFPYQILKGEEIEDFEVILTEINNQCNLSLLQTVDNQDEEIEFYVFDKGSEISASLDHFPKLKTDISFDCLNCRPAKCYEYSTEELKCVNPVLQEIPDKNPQQVCPVGAISFDNQLFPQLNYSKCLDCGICIARCDYGAINYQNEELIISQTLSKQNLKTEKANLADAKKCFSELEFTLKYTVDNDLMLEILSKFFKKVQKLKQDDFYPLVRNLLRSLDLKAKVGKSGDTQWRYDAIVVEPFVMPIEIKSPTEDSFINPNSIRQAIENSITIEASHSLVKKAISGVVALMYSNKRSAAEDMLKDANDLHNMRILLISVVVLAYLNLKDLENKFTIKDIEFLFNNTIGSFDNIAIREFWINYLARREELEALDSKASYYAIKDKVSNQSFEFQEKLKQEFEVFERVFNLIKAKK